MEPDERRKERERTEAKHLLVWSGLAAGLLGTAALLVAHFVKPPPPVSRAGFDVDIAVPEPSTAPVASMAPRRMAQPIFGTEPPAAAPVQAAAPAAPPPAPAPAVVGEEAVKKDAGFTALLASPAKFLASKTLLGKPQRLKGFLADERRTQRYINNPIVHGVLSSPTLMRMLVRPTMIRAFIGSPAMGDRESVRVLAKSPLLKQLAGTPGVQAVLQDQAFINNVLLDGETMSWLGKNPEAMGALSEFGPAFAAAAMMPPR